MAAAAKTTRAPEFVEAARSHWVEFPTSRAPVPSLPFEREEVHPIVRVTVPRAGTVRAEFSCDRYVASVWSEDGGTSTNRMGGWRIILRDVREDAEPEGGGYPQLASGVGPAARAAIREACEPLIVAWLEGAGYRASRRKAAAYAYRRELKDAAGRGGYAIRRPFEYLETIEAELAPMELASLREATEKIAAGLELVDREPVGC